jgi:phosphoribosylformylglycinamidine synthase
VRTDHRNRAGELITMNDTPGNPPRTLILRTAGTNCDEELAFAFEQAGAQTRRVHLNRLIAEPELFEQFELLGIPGGFSYGDDIAAGRILAHRLRQRLYPALRKFVEAGKPVIGICNGFQVLVKVGLLPGLSETLPDDPPPQTVTLTDNTVPRFVARWSPLRTEPDSVCIWTQGLETFDLPVAHGEGRFVTDESVLGQLESNGQVVLRYAENPNGSMRDIAGICDRRGVVLGLMPHPERYTDPTHHPRWTRGAAAGDPPGLQFFRNAVSYAQQQRHTSV